MKGIFEKKKYFELSGIRTKGFRGYHPMFHSHGELLYAVKGDIRTVVDGKEHLLKEGELMIVFPYLTHSYDDAPNTEAVIILFDPTVIAFDNTLISKKPLCHFCDGKAFFPLLDRAVTLIRSEKMKTALGYVNAVIGELLEILPLEEADKISGDTPVRVLEYCSEHFTEDISTKAVADALYISQSYVSKIFSEKLKYSFREYVNSLRIEKAKALLENSDEKIVDIMLECGFKNQSSFNRVFRDICGVSPAEYKHLRRI